jgi:hypothetical protein
MRYQRSAGGAGQPSSVAGKLKLYLDIEIGEPARHRTAEGQHRIRDRRNLDEQRDLTAVGLQSAEEFAVAGELQELL